MALATFSSTPSKSFGRSAKSINGVHPASVLDNDPFTLPISIKTLIVASNLSIGHAAHASQSGSTLPFSLGAHEASAPASRIKARATSLWPKAAARQSAVFPDVASVKFRSMFVNSVSLNLEIVEMA